MIFIEKLKYKNKLHVLLHQHIMYFINSINYYKIMDFAPHLNYPIIDINIEICDILSLRGFNENTANYNK